MTRSKMLQLRAPIESLIWPLGDASFKTAIITAVPFRAVFIAVVIGFALIVSAFLFPLVR